MSHPLFTHLHAHTEFSLLDGSNKIKDYLDRVKSLGMKSAAITDHGVMYGVVEFYKYAKKVGIHPIIGCEVYVAPHSMHDKREQNVRYYHLVLLAENNTGYSNLIRLVSKGFTEGYYYRPRIDLEALNQYHEGIIALSGCLSGEVAKYLSQGQYEAASNAARRYQSIFGPDNFYLELQDQGIPCQKKVNEGLVRMGRELKIPLVATNDIHYTKKEDASSHDVLLCIQTRKKISDEKRMRYDSDQFYIKSVEEMAALFPYAEEALGNTNKIAERCQVEFSFNTYHLPEYDAPNGYTSWEYLQQLCQDGIQKRYPKNSHTLTERLTYELETIRKMGFVDYFLIVWDFINFAKKNKIPVGPGRGSAAGSLVAYCLKITDIDPIQYDLLFERFLNPERVTMPDIDIDFCYERREEVIDYVISKYGSDHVAQIVTFGTMGAKMVIRDVGRVLDLPYATVDKVAKLISNDAKTINEALSNAKEFREWYEKEDSIRELIDIAKCLEGLPRHTSIHAAGVVICPRAVNEYVPLAISNDGTVTTQYVMTTLEELGLLKMDFLALRTLTVLHKTEMDVQNKYERPLEINYNDKEVFQYIGTGQTEGIFQLESEGMKQFMKKLQPESMEDIISGISLYRPGPMDFIPQYIKGKSDPSAIQYDCPQLKPILEATYGCIIYQEQVMQIVRILAGYSYGRADLVRRAMSKKKEEIMEQERQVFLYGDNEIPGCIKNGIKEETANNIFDGMIDFAKYAFNKSHAAAYAVVSYQTAYMKYHYPVEYVAALMTSVRSNATKTADYLLLSRQMNISILKPDINAGDIGFVAKDQSIIYSLSSIKDVGDACVKAILTERCTHSFSDLKDFLSRMSGKDGFRKTTVEALIKAGALDSLASSRRYLMNHYPDLLDQINYEKKCGMAGQPSLFQMFNSPKQITSCEQEYEKAELLAYEKEVLGIYLSGHPLEDVFLQWQTGITAKSTDFFFSEEAPVISEGQQVTIGGIITKVTIKNTRKNKKMALINLEDLFGSVELLVFPVQYDTYKDFLVEDKKIFCTGTVKIEEEKDAKLLAEKIFDISTHPGEIWIQFQNRKHYEDSKEQFHGFLKKYTGNSRVNLFLKDTKQVSRLSHEKIVINNESVKFLTDCFGKENIKIQ